MSEACAALTPARASSMPFSTSSRVYFSDFLGLGLVGPGSGERAPGDLYLDRHLLTDPVEVGMLAGQLGPGGVELSLRDVDLVPVWHGIDLRHDLPLDDLVVLIDEVPDSRPETNCGATLTMWASTNTSSVIE